jgi:CubicO group peptidase (beta-lactamase class C family)
VRRNFFGIIFADCPLIFFVVSALLATPSVMHAQPSQLNISEKLDSTVRAYLPGQVFMGTVLIEKGGTTLLKNGYGLADIDHSIENSPQTQFRIGSLTKQFTAAAILLLQQDHKLSVDDPVNRYVPNVPSAWTSVTLAQLLNHTSGIPDFTREPGFLALKLGPRPWPQAFFQLHDTTLLFQPGARFDYSSTNYELLGLVVEAASGMPYGAFLQKRIFGPLHMDATGLATDGLSLPHMAQGYALQRDGSIAPARSPQLADAWAAGAIFSTVGDLLRWERSLFSHAILSEASLKAMTTPGLGAYGFGVSVETVDGMRVISHGGAIEGFHSFLMYLPKRQITVAVLSNVEGPAADKMAEQLLSVSLGHEDVLPPISDSELDRFNGTFDLKDAGFTLTFRRDGHVLNSLSGNDVIPLVYEGLEGGKPTFFVPRLGAEISFAPNATGAMASMVLHQNGRDMVGIRQ